ncbi:hypothetical protein Fot_10696 [Forsythia ovata]|uniref:Uncharacterized protein n=1 Tax=Forsythia ovata TaxID=205694 RepID=A0ABD1WHK2_9LAMI
MILTKEGNAHVANSPHVSNHRKQAHGRKGEGVDTLGDMCRRQYPELKNFASFFAPRVPNCVWILAIVLSVKKIKRLPALVDRRGSECLALPDINLKIDGTRESEKRVEEVKMDDNEAEERN